MTRDHAEDVYVALRDAFDAAIRQLKDYVRKLRGEIKKHEPKRIRETEESEEAADEDTGA